MENSPVDFAYANFAFVDDTESSSSETENKVEDVSNNKTQTSDLVELAGQTDGVSNNVESSKAGFEELPITDVKEGKVDSLAVSEVEQCDIVDVTDDKHHSVDDDTILNKIENEATASEDIINDVVTPHKNVGRAPNDIANQGSIIEITNGGINRNGNHKLGRLCADKIFRAKVIRTFFILWNYTIFVSTSN